MVQWNTPLQLSNGVSLKNRLMMAPMTTDDGTDFGALSQDDYQFILKRARGFGAIVIGSHSVSEKGAAFEKGWNAYGLASQKALTRLVDALHALDVKVILQIYHAGRMAQPAFIHNEQPLGPSRIPALRPFASYPREMTHAEILEVIADFSAATEFAYACGCDGVEIHGANTYLIQQFYSPHSNRRKDAWGEKMCLPLKIVEAVLAVAKKRNLIVGYRFSPEELEEPGIRLKDTNRLLAALDAYSLNYVHVSINDYRKQTLEGGNILAQLSTEHPLVTCGHIQTSEDVKGALAYGELVSVGSAVVIDPDWAMKVQTGNDAHIYHTFHSQDRITNTIPPRLWQSLNSSAVRYFGKGERE